MTKEKLKNEKAKDNIDQPIISGSAIKPPIGLIPKWVKNNERFGEVCGAISRYYNVGLKIPIEWIVEYNELVGHSANPPVMLSLPSDLINNNRVEVVWEPGDFLNNNRVEVVWDLSQQYLCYINYKEGDGAYGLGMTFLEALQNGIDKYKERGS